MKFDFLKTKVSIFIIGSIVGLTIGFKVANIQLRNEQGLIKRNAVVEAAGQLSQSTNTGNGPSLTPEQRQQINNQVSAAVDKAKANPEDFEAQLDAAAQFIQTINRPLDAFPYLEQARKLKPNDPRPLAGLGVANMMLGRVDEAIKVAKQAREMDPKNPTVAMLLFMVYLETGSNFSEAEQLLRELEANGMDPQRVAQMRRELDNARSGAGAGGGGAGTGSSSTLDHGPRKERPGGNR
jgi:tetratricopeptide (TPR) repeat protein